MDVPNKVDSASASRAAGYYQMWLVIFMSTTWLLHLSKAAKASKVALLGMSVSDKLLLGIVPGVSTILLLGLLGAVVAARGAGSQGGWTNYVSALWPGLAAKYIHGVVLLAVVASTFTVGMTLAQKFKGNAVFLFTAYCLACIVIQAFAGWKWFSKK